MIPFANCIFEYNHSFSIKKWFFFFLFGFIASISNEQVALCLSTFSLISITISFYYKRKINIRLLLLTFLIIIATSILIFAPGNKLRWVSEVHTWFPGYDKLTLKSKIHLGLIWIYKQLYYEMRNIILLLSAIIFCIYCKEKGKYNIAFFIFSLMFFTIIASIFLDNHIFYNFDLIKSYSFSHNIFYFWKSDTGFTISVFPYIFWTIFGILLFYLILTVSKNKFFHFLCLAGSICTMVIMFFSPTIYASGPKTLVVGSVLLSIVSASLIKEFKLLESRLSVFLFSCLPFLNLIQLYISW